MKKILLVIAMLSILLMTGCNQNENIESNNVQENQNNEQQEVVGTDLNKSFEERTKEASDWMNQGDSYGIEKLGHCSKEHFVSNASMEKKDNYYVMKLQISSSKIYEKSEIEELANIAKENTTETNTLFDGDDEAVKALTEMYENRKNDSSVVFIDGFTEYQITPNDSTKCCANQMQFAGGYDGFMITEIEKEIDVVLLPNDKMVIIPTGIFELETDLKGKEITVDEFYQKALNNEKSSDDLIYGFEYTLNNIGDYQDHYAGYTNAIYFDNGYVNINYKNGGV